MFKKENAFSLFNLPLSFDVNMKFIEKAYLTLNQRFHPDCFAQASSHEKLNATLATAQINEAYETLKDPLARGYHLLKILDPTTQVNQDQTIKDQDLLMDVMEYREALDNASTNLKIQNLLDETTLKQKKTLADIQSAFDQKNIDQARLNLYRYRYYSKFTGDATKKLHTNAITT